MIIPLAFLVGVVTTSDVPSAGVGLRALVVWFAVEYLAYQARYQWNDIRGFWSDAEHPDRDRRGRLPGPVERGRAHIAASWAVLVVRVAVALLLVVLLPGLHLGAILIPAVVAVFVVAVVYEAVRERAAACTVVERPGAAAVALWVVSGAGYCVRGLTGLTLAVGTDVGRTELAVAGATCWLAGIVFVTTRWAVETIPFATRKADRLEWRATSAQGRGHLLPLASWIPQTGSPPEDLRAWRPLWTPCQWHAPWNVALGLAIASAWLAGTRLTGSSIDPLAMGGSIVVLAFGWAALVRHPAVSTGTLAGLAMFGFAAAAGDPAQALPAVVVAVLYLLCAHQNLAEIGVSMFARAQLKARAVVAAAEFPRVSEASGR